MIHVLTIVDRHVRVTNRQKLPSIQTMTHPNVTTMMNAIDRRTGIVIENIEIANTDPDTRVSG